MVDIVNTKDELRTLVAHHGPLRLKFDGGRLPLLNGDYHIVGWLGRPLTPADLQAAIDEVA